jgi:uncharacterized membrane protein
MSKLKRLVMLGRIVTVILTTVGVFVIGKGLSLHGEPLDACPLVVGTLWTGGGLWLASVFTRLNKADL